MSLADDRAFATRPRGSGPLISVIIPTYNRVAQVHEAIASVACQTYPEVELIVVDDGSTDGTLEQLERLSAVHLVTTTRAGSAAARNAGLARATGTLIASLDSDDIWSPEFLEVAASALERHQADFVFANWVADDRLGLDDHLARGALGEIPSSADEQGWIPVAASQARATFLGGCPAPSSSVLVRRASMRPWNEELRIADDWYLLLELALRSGGCRCAFTTTPLWTKRTDGSNKYDGRSWTFCGRHLWWHDAGLILDRLGHRMTPAERGRWRRRRLKAGVRVVCVDAKHRSWRAVARESREHLVPGRHDAA